MNLSKKVVLALFQQAKSDSAKFKELIEGAETIARAYEKANYELSVARKAFEAKEKEHKDLIKHIRKSCKHPDGALAYYGDPSGGHDSYHECEICGAQL